MHLTYDITACNCIIHRNAFVEVEISIIVSGENWKELNSICFCFFDTSVVLGLKYWYKAVILNGSTWPYKGTQIHISLLIWFKDSFISLKNSWSSNFKPTLANWVPRNEANTQYMVRWMGLFLMITKMYNTYSYESLMVLEVIQCSLETLRTRCLLATNQSF